MRLVGLPLGRILICSRQLKTKKSTVGCNLQKKGNKWRSQKFYMKKRDVETHSNNPIQYIVVLNKKKYPIVASKWHLSHLDWAIYYAEYSGNRSSMRGSPGWSLKRITFFFAVRDFVTRSSKLLSIPSTCLIGKFFGMCAWSGGCKGFLFGQ